jgi:hypothetical protein
MIQYALRIQSDGICRSVVRRQTHVSKEYIAYIYTVQSSFHVFFYSHMANRSGNWKCELRAQFAACLFWFLAWIALRP